MKLSAFFLAVHLVSALACASATTEPAATQPAMLARSWSTDFALVHEGRGCDIIRPDGAQWDAAVRHLADSIERIAGQRPRVLVDIDVIADRLGSLPDDLRDRPLILLGDLNSNRVFFTLYCSYYSYCDAVYPGDNGYVLRTVVRPFGRPTNYLIVGGSTPAGVEAGVTRLVHRLEEQKQEGGQGARPPSVPCMLDVKLGPQLQSELQPLIDAAVAEDAVAATQPTSQPADAIEYGDARDRFMRNAHLYYYTGSLAAARQARVWALHLAYREPPGIRVADYTMENLASAWRRVSTAPVFTPQERQLIDTRFFETAQINANAWWRQKGDVGEIGGRHHSTGMFAWWTLLRGLLEVAEPDDVARTQLVQWRVEAEGYLDGMLRHYWDDLDDYQSADSAQNSASYALQARRLEWFDNGLARRAATKLMALTDNLGWYVGVQGYGEALPGWERFTLNGGLLLGACGFVYDDAGFEAVLQRFPAMRASWGALEPWGLHEFARPVPTRSKPALPDWLNGLQILRLPRYRLDLLNGGRFLNSPLMDGFAVTGLRAPNVAASLAYDKVVYRSGPDATDTNWLLQGMSGIALSTIDMNALIRYTDQGKLWLVHNTGRMSLFFKNAVYISDGLNDVPLPAACELVAHTADADVAMIASRLPDCRGTDWTRNIVSVGNRFTAVIDQVRARRAGDWTISCNWRTPDWATLDESGWVSQQDAVSFHVLPGEFAGMESARSPVADGATRPTVLREHRRFKTSGDESLFYENVLYTSGPQRTQAYELRRVAPGAVLMRTSDEVWLIAAGDRGIVLPDVESDALVLAIHAGEIWTAGGSYARIGDERMKTAGHTRIDAAQTASIAAALDRLWNASSPVRPEPVKQAAPSATPAPAALWTHAGPSTHGSLVDGVRIVDAHQLTGPTLLATDWLLPTLRAEPRLSPQRGSGSTLEPARHVDPQAGDPLEPQLAPLVDSAFTLALPRSTRVSEIDIVGKCLHETDRAAPPGQMQVELTFRDGDKQEQRTITRTVARQTRWYNLYKGHAYAFEFWPIDELDETCRAVHVRFLSGPYTSMPLNDVQIRTSDGTGVQPVQVRAMDLDGDGSDELMTWMSQGDFLLLDAAGRELWRRSWPAGIVAVDAWDLESDGRKEIFVSLDNWQMLVLNLDGSPRWQVDWADMNVRTDGKFYSDGSLIYGMTAWQPAGRDDKQVLLTSYYFAATLNSRGVLEKCFRRSGYFTQVRAVPAGLADAGNLVTRSDIPWTGPVPLEWLDQKTGEVAARCNVPNGAAVLVEVADFDHDGTSETLVAAEQGIGLYSPLEPHKRWEHTTEAALVGAGIIPASANAPARFVYARQDGYIFVVDIAGHVLAQVSLDQPIACLTAVPSTSVGNVAILVGTNDTLRCLRASDLAEVWRRPGTFQSLTPTTHQGHVYVIAADGSGSLQAIQP